RTSRRTRLSIFGLLCSTQGRTRRGHFSPPGMSAGKRRHPYGSFCGSPPLEGARTLLRGLTAGPGGGASLCPRPQGRHRARCVRLFTTSIALGEGERTRGNRECLRFRVLRAGRFRETPRVPEGGEKRPFLFGKRSRLR